MPHLVKLSLLGAICQAPLLNVVRVRFGIRLLLGAGVVLQAGLSTKSVVVIQRGGFVLGQTKKFIEINDLEPL